MSVLLLSLILLILFVSDRELGIVKTSVLMINFRVYCFLVLYNLIFVWVTDCTQYLISSPLTLVINYNFVDHKTAQSQNHLDDFFFY